MKQAETEEYVSVGKIGSTYGVLGWVKILSFTEVTANILNYKPWYIEEGRSFRQIDVTDGREHGKGIIVKIAGYDSPERARVLAGKTIAVLRSQLPKPDEGQYYWNDLKGLTVIDQNGQSLGTVMYVLETGANDVLVVKGTKEHAIPYLPGTVIKHVDLDKQEIYVDWEVI